MSKIALVTGANRGLGLAIARQLARAGHTTVIGARDARKGVEAAELLRSEGLDAEVVELDVDDPTSVERAGAELRDRHGALDVLVNNAGICPGFVQTDLTPINRGQAPLVPADAARVVVRYALIDESGPSGGFFDQEAAVPW